MQVSSLVDHSFIPGAPKKRQVVMASSQTAIPDAVAPGGTGKVCPAVVRKVVGATSGCIYCLEYATPFDLPSFGRGAISERELTEGGTISESDIRSECNMWEDDSSA